MGTDLIKIKCHKGAKDGDMFNIEVSRDTPLCDIRILLEDKSLSLPIVIIPHTGLYSKKQKHKKIYWMMSCAY